MGFSLCFMLKRRSLSWGFLPVLCSKEASHGVFSLFYAQEEPPMGGVFPFYAKRRPPWVGGPPPLFPVYASPVPLVGVHLPVHAGLPARRASVPGVYSPG